MLLILKKCTLLPEDFLRYSQKKTALPFVTVHRFPYFPI